MPKILIIVVWRYADILKEFLSTWVRTTEKFPEVQLCPLRGGAWDNPPPPKCAMINKLIDAAEQEGFDAMGVFNDDLWLNDGWIESVVELLEVAPFVSPGCIETSKRRVFECAIEKTREEHGWNEYFMPAAFVFKIDAMKQLGGFEETLDWGGDDWDILCRLTKKKIQSVTARKITVAHWGGRSFRRYSRRKYRDLTKHIGRRLRKKYGAEEYNELKVAYLKSHAYFDPSIYA